MEKCNHHDDYCKWRSCSEQAECFSASTDVSPVQVERIFMRKERLKKEVDKILIDALGGLEKKYVYQDRFVRWGAVGMEIHLKIDEAFKDLSA
jgi:hypothetical protein